MTEGICARKMCRASFASAYLTNFVGIFCIAYLLCKVGNKKPNLNDCWQRLPRNKAFEIRVLAPVLSVTGVREIARPLRVPCENNGVNVSGQSFFVTGFRLLAH